MALRPKGRLSVRILLFGASGLIGAAVCARLAGDGHEVVGVSRHPPTAGLGHVRHLGLDLEALLQLTLPPCWLSILMYKLGDALSGLGRRSPVRTTARREIAYGAVGDPRGWSHLTGIQPTDIELALTREPASIQDRWFARLYS